jgi:hypothetical protein
MAFGAHFAIFPFAKWQVLLIECLGKGNIMPALDASRGCPQGNGPAGILPVSKLDKKDK